jgi:hypothetical protein
MGDENRQTNIGNLGSVTVLINHETLENHEKMQRQGNQLKKAKFFLIFGFLFVAFEFFVV